VVAALKRGGFAVERHKGSHTTMHHPLKGLSVVVPEHAGKIVKLGTLSAIISGAGLSVEEFIGLLKG
jgi:predicted RNA binding protein YcfA (HicA-like mRNA interferase family)